MHSEPKGKCPRCQAKWTIFALVIHYYRCPECHHKLRFGSFIQVISASGAVLTPCTITRAEQEIQFGRAKWETPDTLRLLYAPEQMAKYRSVVRLRDDGRCVWCGNEGSTVDHIIPDSKGGVIHPTNFLWACEKCNRERQNRDVPEYLDDLDRTGKTVPNRASILDSYAAALKFARDILENVPWEKRQEPQSDTTS